MTWQRIDENTYIDDTLVTCAEYQLFIDELREQGKYYQPDHWTSYQFPTGKAQDPILGVRHADAVAFCRWLTKRETGLWFYRLPYPNEALNYLLASHRYSHYSYWSRDSYGVVSRVNVNPIRLIEIDMGESIRARDLDPDIALLRSNILSRTRDINPDSEALLDRVFDNIHKFISIQVHSDAYINFLNQTIMIDNTLAKTRNAENGLDAQSTLSLAQSRDNLRALALELETSSEPQLDSDHTLAYVYALDPDIALGIDRLIDTLISREILAMSIVLDGVRLVKERIR